MSASGEPITICPVCRYDFTGLPKNHTCPECGFEYEESMRIWYARLPPKTFLLFLFFLLAITPFGMLSVISFQKTGSFVPPRNVLFRMTPMVLLASLPLQLCFAVPLMIMHRRRPFVLVGENAIYIRYMLARIHKFSWQELSVRGWLIKQFRSDAAYHGERGAASVPKSRRWLVRLGLWGSQFDFRVVISRQGEPERTIQLPIRVGAAYVAGLQRAIYERWSRATQQPSGLSAAESNRGVEAKASRHRDT